MWTNIQTRNGERMDSLYVFVLSRNVMNTYMYNLLHVHTGKGHLQCKFRWLIQYKYTITNVVKIIHTHIISFVAMQKTSLMVHGKRYNLVGAFIFKQLQANINHYVAFVRSQTDKSQWYYTDDATVSTCTCTVWSWKKSVTNL